MRHTISVQVENHFGVLARISGLFSGRGFNIESLSVAETLDPTKSHMTIVTRGSDKIIEQVTKQLNKLIDVIKVVDVSSVEIVERELILIKMSAQPQNRAEILRICEIFRGKIVDVSQGSYTLEVTGAEGKTTAIIEMLKPLGVKEIIRTGKIAMLRESSNDSR